MPGLYRRYVLPRLVHAACGVEALSEERARIVPRAAGRVVDLGFGSGLNLPFYDPARVEHVWALEPSTGMWGLARESVASARVAVEHVRARAEAMPLEDGCANTIVATYTLCSIGDLSRALEEMRRVLAPGGHLLFLEHGAAPERDVLRWQKRIEPVWRRVAGGCHLTRRIPHLLEAGGFRIAELSTGYAPGWKIDSFLYRGTATPARPRRLARLAG